MNPIINILMLIIGFVFGLFINSQVVIPLIYGLPKSIWYFLKGEVKFMAIIVQFFPPIFWTVGLFIIGIIFELINPKINNFITNSGFSGGWTLSIFAILFSFLSVSNRATTKAEYDNNTYEKYKKIK